MPTISVSPVEKHELMPALRLLVGPVGDQDLRAENCRAAFAAGDYDPAGLFVARDELGGLSGVALMQVMPGALGVAWPSRGIDAETEDCVTQAAITWLRERGVKVCQAFASSTTEMAALERNGFRNVTQLVYMQRPVDLQSGWGGRPRFPVRCRPGTSVLSLEQIEVLLATHEGTLDCPELNGLRTREEVIHSYFAGNQPNSIWWLTSGEGDRLIGVLLFDQGLAANVLELSYLGVVPALRGRGVGETALGLVNQIAGKCGYQSVSVTVDARNRPALGLYEKHGFVESDRRQVFLAIWSERLDGGV